MHIATAAMGLATITKGPPAAYPLIFFVALCAARKNWEPLRRFVTCGAPLTFLIIALPWFVYVAANPIARQLASDAINSAEGHGHRRLFTKYILDLALAALPWTGFMALALVSVARRDGRSDARLRGLLMWIASILIPLCLWGNKQIHYLLPVMPPLMILVGWAIDRWLNIDVSDPDDRDARAGRMIWVGSLIASGIVAPAVVIVGYLYRGHVTLADAEMGISIALLLDTVLLVYWGQGIVAGVIALAMANTVAIALTMGVWSPTLIPVNCRSIAAEVRSKYGPDTPFVFFGAADLRLCFHMRRIIPAKKDASQLAMLTTQQPELITIQKFDKADGPLKRGIPFDDELTFDDGRHLYRFGHVRTPSLISHSTDSRESSR
jgi:hypothetical protein